MTKNYLRYLVAAAFVGASGASNVALAVDERESNDSISSAQRLVIGSSRTVEVAGILGVAATITPVVADVDFYSFHARAGDVVTIDIDGGMKATGSSMRSADTVLAIYGPDLTAVPRQIDDVASSAVDSPGSISRFDARLDNVHLPVSGIYTVGVTSSGRTFLPGGEVTSFVARSTSNGSYTLIISGVSPSVKPISIDIKPGTDRIARINPKSKGKIRVALLSSADFNPLNADPGSITFGPNGTEATGRCGKDGRDDDDDDDNDDRHGKHGKRGKDFNRDGLPDLVCRFEIRAAGFDDDEGDEEGIVKGTIGGMPFEGRGWLKVIPVKRDKD